MGLSLVTFVYNTMKPRLNNQKSKYWLPTILSEVKHPQDPQKKALVPLEVPEWELGELSGETGNGVGNTIASVWWFLLLSAFDKQKKNHNDWPKNLDDFTGRRDAGAPQPKLKLSKVKVHGLPNIAVGELTDLVSTGNGGYKGAIPIIVAAYETGPWQKKIEIEGEYTLTQSVVAADDPKNDKRDPLPPTEKDPVPGLQNYQWPKELVEGTGKAVILVTGLQLRAEVEIFVTGKKTERKPRVNVVSVSLAPQTGPTFDLDEKRLTINKGKTITEKTMQSWKKLAANAFRSQDARKELTSKLVQNLNAADIKTSFSDAATEQLGKALDGVLGAVAEGQLPSKDTYVPPGEGPVERYLFDRIRASLADPKSPFYPPAVTFSVKDPALDPAKIKQIDLGPQKIDDELDFSSVVVNAVTISAIPNVEIPSADAKMVTGGIEATLRFGTIADEREVTYYENGEPKTKKVPKAPLTLKGDIVLTFRNSGDKMTGKITIKVPKPSVLCGLSAGGPDADQLVITVNKLDLVLKADEYDVIVEMGDLFQEAIKKLFNSTDVKEKILTGVKDQMQKSKGKVANGLSQAARSVIGQRLTQ
ncbi:hypothetical protein [Streptomyces sp. NPDC007100]|uniref:hypothetical protein n=1 Tax=Streptomyces sp. NPDC007100 TaxID=3155602 RepID=UPI0033DD7553